MAVELKPEPEGGEEVTAVKTMAGSRMKNMGQATGVKSDLGTVYSFWMQATVNGALIKDLNTQVLKDAKKKANFPGFRKGQVPPFAMCM
jgi:Bacterial trigger factor protein (TF)